MEWKLLTRTCGATRWCGTIWKGKKALNLILANTSSREVLAGTSDVERQEPGCILKEKNWQPPRTWLEESISCLSDKKLGWVWHRRSKADLVLAAKWPRSLLASFWWGHLVWTRSKDVFAPEALQDYTVSMPTCSVVLSMVLVLSGQPLDVSSAYFLHWREQLDV